MMKLRVGSNNTESKSKYSNWYMRMRGDEITGAVVL
jgi:hypothetical protein